MKLWKIFFVSAFILLASSNAFAVQQLLGFHGKVTDSNVVLSSGDLEVLIYDASSGGALIYDSGTDYNGSISNGIFDVMLGDNTALDLNYGQYYYIDMQVNGLDLDFGANERKQFEASRGQINSDWIMDNNISNADIASTAAIDWSKISKTGSGLSELGFDVDFNNTYIRQADGNAWYLITSDGNQIYYTQTDLNELLQISDFNNVWISQNDGNAWYARKEETETISGSWNFTGTMNYSGGFGSNGATIQDGILYIQSIVIVNDFNAATVNAIDINGDYQPSIHNQFDFGSDSMRWRTIYGQDANFQTISVPANAISWVFVDKTGSNLTDLATRNHNDLQNISGGAAADYYHLTSAQHTNLTALSGVWETINGNTGSTSANAFPDTLLVTGSEDIDVTISGDIITIDYNGTGITDTDTNWSTSWSVFDANLSNYYVRQSDGNLWYAGINDVNNWLNQFAYGSADFNSQYKNTDTDTNIFAMGLINDNNVFIIDLNTTGNFHSDGNYLCDELTCYLISDLNQQTAVDLTSYVPWADGNQTYWIQADLNAILQISDFNNVYISQNDGNTWYAIGTDINSWINQTTYGSTDFNTEYKNTDTVVLRTYTGQYGITINSDTNTIQLGTDFNTINDTRYTQTTD
ncbi:MAG: hypothetical protein ABIA76_01180, partial [Candidatus Diapherotrites archaeon]